MSEFMKKQESLLSYRMQYAPNEVLNYPKKYISFQDILFSGSLLVSIIFTAILNHHVLNARKNVYRYSPRLTRYKKVTGGEKYD
ncbi:MAG: hypothetical protein KAS12_06585 [Candidatus Aenigmarchaeota archaeon]|nr:hypothetical protein [Candidatus Aenigmarchaeota archaeon]